MRKDKKKRSKSLATGEAGPGVAKSSSLVRPLVLRPSEPPPDLDPAAFQPPPLSSLLGPPIELMPP